MEEQNTLKAILKWAGIAALVAIPLVVIFKKRKESSRKSIAEDDSNIFASELEE